MQFIFYNQFNYLINNKLRLITFFGYILKIKGRFNKKTSFYFNET